MSWIPSQLHPPPPTGLPLPPATPPPLYPLNIDTFFSKRFGLFGFGCVYTVHDLLEWSSPKPKTESELQSYNYSYSYSQRRWHSYLFMAVFSCFLSPASTSSLRPTYQAQTNRRQTKNISVAAAALSSPKKPKRKSKKERRIEWCSVVGRGVRGYTTHPLTQHAA